jgi:predicted metalloprotease with PDZ domain
MTCSSVLAPSLIFHWPEVLGPTFRLDLRQPKTHRFSVQLNFRAQQHRESIALPSWTPGSYLERDYVRHLEGLQAWVDGQPACLERRSRHLWWLEALPLGAEVELRYSLLAVEPSVRTNWLDAETGFLTAAAWAMEVESFRWQPHQVNLLCPEGWKVATSLEPVDGGWRAKTFDVLVDSPLALGDLQELTFSVGGVPHRWVWQGLQHPAPLDCWQEQLPKICTATCALLGEQRPVSKDYLFMTRFSAKGYGGLEHDDGCALMFSRRELSTAAGQRRLLQLSAHEYLHQWNVRRLRPVGLRPYRYGQAVLIPELWFAEGVTSYYDQLIVLQAGLCSEEDYLEDLSKDISRYLSTPGRQVQSLLDSASEAWVKLYRRDAHSDNQQISYYLKGALVSLLLDLHLLAQGKGLHVLLQQLWQRFGVAGRGYSQADVANLVGELDPQLPALLESWLVGVDELPLSGYLKSVGLDLCPDPAESPYCGLQLVFQEGQLNISKVDRDSPAELAGLSPGDELLALDAERLRTTEQFGPSLTAGGQHDLLFCRDGAVRSTELRPLAAQPCRWSLRLDPNASEAVCRLRRSWFQGPAL